MNHSLMFQIHATSTRNQIVFPNQLYLNLHTKAEPGTFQSLETAPLSDVLFYQQQQLSQMQNQGSPLNVYIPEKLNLDLVFTLYVLQNIFQSEHSIAAEQYENAKHFVFSDSQNKPYHSLGVIFAGFNKSTDIIATCNHMFKLFQDLHLLQDETIIEKTHVVELLLENHVESKAIVQQLKEDYHNYVNQRNDNRFIQTRQTGVLKKGTTALVSTLVVTKHIHSDFFQEWITLDGHELLIKMIPTTTGHHMEICSLHPDIHFHTLRNHLAFNEQYISHGNSAADWIQTDTIRCENSSLSKEQFMELIDSHLDPWVTKQQVNYVFPFHFDYQKHNQVEQFLLNKFSLQDETAKNQEFQHTFLPLFNDYLFNNEKLSTKQLHSRKFVFKRDVYLSIQEGHIRYHSDSPTDGSPIFSRRIQVEIRQFRYGVGFLTIRSDFNHHDAVPLNYVLDIDEIVAKHVKETFEYFLGSYPEIRYNATRKGIAYESLQLEHASYISKRQEKITLKTCSANKRSYISDPDELKSELADKFLTRGDYVFYGFSRSCGVQFIVDDDVFSKKSLQRLTENFMNEKFYIFLFAIQQRDSIRQFSDTLVGSSLTKQKLETSRIRRDFLEFMTQVRLSHISDHNVITLFYNRWRTIFDSESIFNELSQKLDALDGYQQSKISYQFNFLSFIIFPIIAISSLFTMGIFATTAIKIDLVYVILANVLFMLAFYIFLRKR